MRLNMPHWRECFKKNKLSRSCLVFKNLRYSVLAIWSIGTFRDYANSLHFCFLYRVSSCKMDCHWGVALRKILYQEWCVSTRKTWTQHLGLTNMFCMNRFRDWEKLLGHYCILVLVFSWREVISESSVYAHFLISYFLKLIPFVLQVELRNSAVWNFHNW